MNVQAYIDDSHKGDGAFALAGHIATEAQWRQLAEEWRKLLPRFGVLNNKDKYAFKRSQMLHRSEDMAPFFRLVEENVLASFSVSFMSKDLTTAAGRQYFPGCAVEADKTFLNPYLYAFFGIFSVVTKLKQSIGFHSETRIDFIFDEQGEKSLILKNWGTVLRHNPKIDGICGSTPRFENDEDFLPLQAADFWAGWVRQWHEDGILEQSLSKMDFGPFCGRSGHIRSMLTYSEDNLFQILTDHVMGSNPHAIIYDLKYGQLMSQVDGCQFHLNPINRDTARTDAD